MVVSLLALLLQDSLPTVRWNAALALGSPAEDPPFLPTSLPPTASKL